MNSRIFTTIFLSCVLCATTSSANIPQLINFQGTLTDSTGNPITGIQSMLFQLYNDSTGGYLPLWSETQSSVEIEDGLFRVILGSVTPLQDNMFNGTAKWLQIEVDGETLTPRTKITSVPYTFKDDHWKTAYGNTVFDKQGNVGIGETFPDAKLQVETTDNNAIHGESTDSIGVYGYTHGYDDQAVKGMHNTGFNGGLGGRYYGVHGSNASADNYGYIGTDNEAILGYSQNGIAGNFLGDVYVSSHLTAAYDNVYYGSKVGPNYASNSSIFPPSGGAIIEGDIGIGTDDPETELHVEGTITVDQTIQADDAGGINFATDDGTTRMKIMDNGAVTIGSGGSMIGEIKQLIGTTTNSGVTSIPYPSGYTPSNTEILTARVSNGTNAWTMMGWTDGVSYFNCNTGPSAIYLNHYHIAGFFNNQPYRIWLLKMMFVTSEDSP